MNRIIAIPSNGPDITNYISEHFGHCEYFVGIEMPYNLNLNFEVINI